MLSSDNDSIGYPHSTHSQRNIPLNSTNCNNQKVLAPPITKKNGCNHNIFKVHEIQSEAAKDSLIKAKHEHGSNAYVSTHRDLKCTLCDKEFTRKYSLYQHYDTHSNQKPYQCQICSKEFTQKHRYRHFPFLHQRITMLYTYILYPLVDCIQNKPLYIKFKRASTNSFRREAI